MSAQGKNNSISGSMLWNLMERACTQGAQLLVSIILARLLLPEAYGVLALITVFVNLATVVVETGFGSSVIQKKDITKQQINVIFTFNLLVAVVLCGALWVLAPMIASFYDNYEHTLLVQVIRIYSLILPLGSVTSIQTAVLYRDMAFKKLFVVHLLVTVISSTVGITMAYMGAGVWALVFQQLSAKAVTLLILLVAVKWKPWLNFRFRQAGSMFRFGGNILLNRLLNMLYHQVSSLVIGKKYTADTLAYYTKGNTFPSIIATNTDYALQKVMFSAYSKYQDDLEKVKNMVRKTICLSTFILSPLMFGMLACTENFIRVVLTDKWLPSTVYMQIFCLSFFLQPIGTTAAQAFNGIGKSNLTLKIGIATKVTGILLVIAAVPLGVIYIALAVLLTTVVSAVVYTIMNKRVLGYKIRQQLQDIGGNMLNALAMMVICFGVGFLCRNMAPIVALVLQVLAGAVWYIGVSIITKNKNITYVINKLQSLKKR
ncbi:MAG: lipopolysaccharide biosynthesis protein [Oscillospiraceae bacterium]|nr:lipopolysaccharide biosynthesis protein [Oscillospiraceae bacterium]